MHRERHRYWKGSACLWIGLWLLCGWMAWGRDGLVTNGGFEKLGADGRPLDWEYVGRMVTVTEDAHTGSYALRFARTDEETPETGLNRSWRAYSGEAGKMLTQTRGGLSYWYKAISGNCQFLFQAIPMSEAPIEGTGSPRVTWQVPPAHVGDGQWHEARFAYDFTDNPRVAYVHVAVRLVNGTGELLVDDISWLEHVGPVPSLNKAVLRPDPGQPAEQAILRAKLENGGDEPLRQVDLRLDLPEGWRAEPREEIRGGLPAGDFTFVSWLIRGERRGRHTLQITAESGALETATSALCEPKLEIESLLAEPFLLPPGGKAELTAKVVNRGNTTSEPMTLRLAGLGGETLSPENGQIPAIPPLGSAEVVWKVWARDAGEARFRVMAEGLEPAESRLVVSPAAAGEAERQVGNFWIRRDGTHLHGEILDPDGHPVALMPSLGVVRFRNALGNVETVELQPYGLTRDADGKKGGLHMQRRDSEGGQWSFHVEVESRSPEILSFRWQVSCDQPRQLLAFDGPMLYVPGRHQEALFPGLEWLEEGEISSSDLDIAREHPDRVRFAPHPNKVTVPLMGVRTRGATVALLWNMKQRWDGEHDRPQPLFAAPDRFEGRGATLMGLMLPSVADGLKENTRLAEEPYALAPNHPLTLDAEVFVHPGSQSVLDALDGWFQVHEPMPLLDLPQGDPLSQIAFSMQAYMRSLWSEQEQGWFSHLGGPAMPNEPAHRPDYAADLLTAVACGASQGSDELENAWRERAEDQLRRAHAYPAGDDLGFRYRDPLLAVTERLTAAERQFASLAPDGVWTFDADRIDRGVFKGLDYHELGPDEAVELGTLARRCYEVLWYARITGDRNAYERMTPTLERMASFTVPRAAQVWEVPVHTPDILAAADAVEAFIEAYGISGEERWLAQARYWAKAGLPFLYVWDAGHPERKWMRYGSIPVFGATWYQGSWFGRIVQWNGLRYAYALMKLWSYDRDGIGGFPWTHFANGIMVSACYQQSEEGANLALWPDAYGTIDGSRANWEFAPKQILKLLTAQVGWAPEPRTIRIAPGREVTENVLIAGDNSETPHAAISGLPLHSATWKDDTLEIRVATAQWVGPPGYLLISGVTLPERVVVGGSGPFDEEIDWREIPLSEGLLSTPTSWREPDGMAWSYDATFRTIRIRLGGSFIHTYRCEGVRPIAVSLLANPVDAIQFDFQEGLEGWRPAHDLSNFRVEDGILRMQVTGSDPYFIRNQLRVKASEVATILVRTRDTAPNSPWQLFFVTEDSPYWEEAKSVRVFTGQKAWHLVRFPVSEHPLWRGKVIGLRLDPPTPPDGEIEIDSVRATE